MTEVNTILGQPETIYDREEEIFWYYECDCLFGPPPIVVRFDSDNKVTNIFWVD